MMAYTGRYHIEGDDVFAVHVDVSWHPSWLGSKQRRYFKIEGDMLSIVSAPGVTVREQTEQPLVEYLTLADLLVLAFTTAWSYRYTRLAQKLTDPERRPPHFVVQRVAWIGVAAGVAGIVF